MRTFCTGNKVIGAVAVATALGAATLGFNPTRRFPLSRIAPTEDDSFFRHSQLHGTVILKGATVVPG